MLRTMGRVSAFGLIRLMLHINASPSARECAWLDFPSFVSMLSISAIRDWPKQQFHGRYFLSGDSLSLSTDLFLLIPNCRKGSNRWAEGVNTREIQSPFHRSKRWESDIETRIASYSPAEGQDTVVFPKPAVVAPVLTNKRLFSQMLSLTRQNSPS